MLEKVGARRWFARIMISWGIVTIAIATDNLLHFACLCVAAAGIFCSQPVLRSLPSKFLTGGAAATGLAAINSVGNLGGFAAQNAVPWLRDATGSTIASMLFLAACLAVGALMTFLVQAAIRRRPRPVPLIA